MNQEIKKLAEEAGLQNTLGCFWQSSDDAIERLVEIVRSTEQQGCAEDYLKIMRDAVEAARQDEREICAALCLEPIQYGRIENNRATTVGGNKFSRQKTYTECYTAIKARGLK
jgi:hypothetical protein